MSDDRAVLEARDLTFTVGADSPLMGPVSLTVDEDETVCLIGTNGSGKTAFLNICAGRGAVKSGSLNVLGMSAKDAYKGRAFKLHAECFGERDVTGAISKIFDEVADRSKIAAALDRVGLSHDTEQPVETLSFGQQRRLAWAQLLATAPLLALIDQPTAHLDMNAYDICLSILRDLRGAKIIATHDLEFVRTVATKVAVFADYKVVAGSVALLDDRALLQRAGVLV